MKNQLHPDIIKKVLLYSLAFMLFVAILPVTAFEGDIVFWTNWAKNINDNGLGQIYNFQTNYHPVFLYFLYFFHLIMGNIEEVLTHFNYVKLFPLLFDFIGALSVFLVIKNKQNAIILPLFLLFNIAYLYNTLLWGQLDSIHTAFALLSLIFVLQSKPMLSICFFVLALNTKLQAIIYLPVVGLMLLPYFFKSYKNVLKGVAVILVTQVIILIPFILADSLDGLWKVVREADGMHPFVSMNAFNFWYYFFETEINPAKILDTSIFALGFSYKLWGRVLFLVFSGIALFPLLRNCFSLIKNQTLPDTSLYELVFLTAGLISIIFFYFNTQMHERYVHPAIIFYFFYGLKSKRYLFYILVSIVYVLNMERVLKAWDFENYNTLIFNPIFIASIFGFIIFGSIFRLYKDYYVKTTSPSPS